MTVQVLVVTKGHPFDRNAFFGMLEAMPGYSFIHVEHPAAQAFFSPEMMAPYDAVLLYDMPGYAFKVPDGVDLIEPPASYRQGFQRLLEAGTGIVALHHALAGWAAWPDYGEWLGGRFLYQPATVRGQARLDSGYRHDVAFTAQVVGDHPVTAGVDARFPLVDELYLAEIFEDSVVPLLRADHAFVAGNFYSADQAIHGRMYSNDGWPHPEGSTLIGWVKHAINSPLAYLQCGDGPSAYDNPQVRRLIANALDWVRTPDARRWARDRNRETRP